MSFIGNRPMAALATGAVLLSGGVAAGQPAPPSAPAADAAQADPARLALARRLLAAQRESIDLPRVLRTVDAQLMETLRRQMPDLDQARAQRMTAAMETVQAQMIPDLTDRMAEAYARNLTQQELTDAVTFYEGPSGRALLRTAPIALGVTMASLGRWIPQMRAAMIDAACADNGCTPEQRRAMTGEAQPSQTPASGR